MAKRRQTAKQSHLFTSESVTEGHPDKLCDQISDGILDEVLRQDSSENARVACETYVTMGLILVGGEITTSAYVDIHKLCRKIIKEIGYNHPKYGFDYHTCTILNAIHTQSPDIAQGVNRGGAGDQGMMIGYATKETPEYMPLPIMLSQKLTRRLAEVRKNGRLRYLGPDGKSQVTVEYNGDRPKRVTSCVIASQHTADVLERTKTGEERFSRKARQELIDVVAKPILKEYLDKDTKYYINETGKFLVGGPQSDTGMTGRKIIVDTYGGTVSHGGGAFSGKDPTKVDRSAAYMARYIAKNIVASGVCNRLLIQLAYVIGRPDPLSIMVDTYGTGKVSDEKIIKLIRDNFDLTPRGIASTLKLRRPIYRQTAAYGHFGRSEADFTWEKVDKASSIKKQA